jgi:hypothetical protein
MEFENYEPRYMGLPDSDFNFYYERIIPHNKNFLYFFTGDNLQ